MEEQEKRVLQMSAGPGIRIGAQKPPAGKAAILLSWRVIREHQSQVQAHTGGVFTDQSIQP